MLILVGLCVCCAVIWFFIGTCVPKLDQPDRDRKIVFFLLLCSGLIVFPVIIIADRAIDSSSIRTIKVGEYQIAEVHNDNSIDDIVILTKGVAESGIRFYSYQLPRKELEGEIKEDAVKLVVFRLETKDGKFRRFRFE